MGYGKGESMTPSQLKTEYERLHPDNYFFTRDTMRFFGDTMRNYGVRNAGTHWELYRKRPVKHGLCSSAYFDKVTLDDTHEPPKPETHN